MKQLTSLIPIALLVLVSTALFWYTRTSREPNKNILMIGTNAEYAPFSFMEHDEIVGFDIDIAKTVAQKLAKQIEWQNMPFDALLPKLQLGDIQIIASGMTPTPERAKKVNFTKPYYTDPLVIVSLTKNPPIRTVKDLDNKEVVVNEGFTSDAYMSAIQGPILKRLATSAEGFLALQSGRAVAFVAALSSVQPYFDIYGKEGFEITPIEGAYDSYALALSLKYPELLPEIQKALDAMEEEGTISALKQKWKLP